MAGFVKIYGSKLITSSLWDEPPEVRLVFLAMAAIADAEGFVDVPNERALARVLNVELDYLQRALAVLMAPDVGSRTPDEEGRRVLRQGSGWKVVNLTKYREFRSPAQESTRLRVAAWREKQAVTSNAVTKSVTRVRTEAEAEAEAEREEDPDPKGIHPRDLPLARSSAEPDSTPARLTFGCAGKVKTWNLTELRIDEWRSAFPALDVEGECRKALAWVNASPRNRKTAAGMAKFLFAWLSRAQDRGRANGTQAPPKPAEPSPYCGPHSRGFRGRVSSEPTKTCPECKHVRALGLTRESEMASVASLLPGYGNAG